LSTVHVVTTRVRTGSWLPAPRDVDDIVSWMRLVLDPELDDV